MSIHAARPVVSSDAFLLCKHWCLSAVMAVIACAFIEEMICLWAPVRAGVDAIVIRIQR